MKILLVNAPTRPPGFPRIYPIQLTMLGSKLIQDSHEVYAIDLDAPKSHNINLDDHLIKHKYDMIGVSFRNLPLAFWIVGFRKLKTLIIKLRKYCSFIVVGGPGFTMFHEKILKKIPQITAGIVGEGEIPISKLAANPLNFKNINGIAYLENNKVKHNPLTDYIKGEDIPPICEINGLKIEGYESYALQSYRGCYINCKNCTGPGLRGQKIRSKKLSDLQNDINFYINNNITHLRFIDPEFNLNLSKANDILDLIISLQQNITWDGFLYPFSDINIEFLLKAKKAGCSAWHIDLESGNEKIFKYLNNGRPIEYAYKLIDILSSLNINAYYYFAYNLPGETFSQEKDTLKLMQYINSKGTSWSQIYSFPYLPYPYTLLSKEMNITLTEKNALWHIIRTFSYIFRPSTLFLFKMFLEKNKFGENKVSNS